MHFMVVYFNLENIVDIERSIFTLLIKKSTFFLLILRRVMCLSIFFSTSCHNYILVETDFVDESLHLFHVSLRIDSSEADLNLEH